MTEIRKGRPRSQATRAAILVAARELIAEKGYDAMTIEAIAERAGSSRQTIYRWWSSKAAIVADAVIAGQLHLPEQGIADTGELKDDLRAWVVAISETLHHPSGVQLVRALAAAASEDEQRAELLYERITGPFYQSLVERLETGKSAGQLSLRADPVAVADALMGTALLHTLTRRDSPDRMLRLVDELIRAI